MSAKKTGRQQVKRARRNRSTKTETRTIIGRANRSLEGGDAEAAQPAVASGHQHLGSCGQQGHPSQEQRSPPQVKDGGEIG